MIEILIITRCAKSHTRQYLWIYVKMQVLLITERRNIIMTNLLSLMRLRTLPLAFAVIVTGNMLAAYDDQFRFSIFLLSLLTALSLQILSNIANDYGDGIRGTDQYRPNTSPTRLTGSGNIEPRYVRRYIIITIIITLILGATLLAVSITSTAQLFLFLVLGILSIIAAMTYTLGRYAYGYYGLGELAVFLFFGWVGVLGSYTLQHDNLSFDMFFPASGAGLLAAAVLNINNIRDIETDPLTGKYTLAVRLGFAHSRLVHCVFLLTACICYLIFALIRVPASALWLMLIPLLMSHIKRVKRAHAPVQVAKELKTTIQLTLGMNLLFCAGLIVSKYIQT